MTSELRETNKRSASRIRPSFNAEKCLALLDEPAIGVWAIEAATDYGVALDDALELLAYALFLDGEK